MNTALRSSLSCLTALLLSLRAAFGQPGSVDFSFHPPSDLRSIRSIAVQLDGKIVAAGEFDPSRGQATLVRLNPDGSPDPSFQTGTGADAIVHRVALLPDGKILIGGGFTSYAGQPRRGIARLNRDGSLDQSFATGSGAEGEVNGIAVQADGRTIIVGQFLSVDGVARAHAARLRADGSLDGTFVPPVLGGEGGSAPSAAVFDTLALPDHKVIISGSFAVVDGVGQTGVARLLPDGRRDPAFVPPLYTASVAALARQSDGSFVTVGDFWGSPDVGVSRLTADGALDPSFSSGICCASEDPMVYATVVQEDGRILVSGRNFHGSSGEVPDYFQSGVVRLNERGNPDPTFRSGAGFPAFGDFIALALQDDGKVLVGGSFAAEGFLPLPGIFRLNNDESSGSIKFAAASFVATEKDGAATILVRRTGGTRGRVSVHYSTTPGTAQPGQDYQPRSGQLVFEDGESLKTFTIPLRADRLRPEAGTVTLVLRQPKGGAGLGSPQEAVLTITE